MRALDARDSAGAADQVAPHGRTGEQRQLEIAMVLATEPEVMLLEEPLAGMGPEKPVAGGGLLKQLDQARDPAGGARHGACSRRGVITVR